MGKRQGAAVAGGDRAHGERGGGVCGGGQEGAREDRGAQCARELRLLDEEHPLGRREGRRRQDWRRGQGGGREGHRGGKTSGSTTTRTPRRKTSRRSSRRCRTCAHPSSPRCTASRVARRAAAAISVPTTTLTATTSSSRLRVLSEKLPPSGYATSGGDRVRLRGVSRCGRVYRTTPFSQMFPTSRPVAGG